MNLWRLLKARIRQGRLRVLTIMVLVAAATGAVIIGLSERIAADPAWDIPAGIAGALMAITAASYGQIWANTRIGQWMAGMSRQVRRTILTGYVALEPSAQDEIGQDGVRDTLGAVSRGLAGLGAEAPAAVQSFLTTLVCVAVTLLIDPVAGAALLLALKLGAVITTALIVRARRGGGTPWADNTGVDRAMDETFRGVRASWLEATGRAAATDNPLQAALARQRAQGSRSRGWIATEGAAGSIGRPLLAVLVVAAARLSSEPADQAVALLLIAFLVPFDWIQAIPRLTALATAADRLASFESSLHTAARRWPPPAQTEGSVFSSLALRNAIFRYPGQPGRPGAIVGPISCDIAPGRIVLLTGGVGAGKTCVLNMLAGLAIPEGGDVMLNGVSADVCRGRAMAAMVTAEPVLLAGMHIPNLARSDIQQLLLDLELSDTVKAGSIPSPSTMPRSVRARIGFLAAVAGDRPLLLLDDWEMGQSLTIRERFRSVMLPRLRETGRAIVVAARDARFEMIADDIIQLMDGRQVSAAAAQNSASPSN